MLSTHDLETRLRDGPTYNYLQEPDRDEKWLKCVRLLPCIRCGKKPCGTAHHIYAGGMGTKCSDYLTISACSDCHTLGPEPFQGMSPQRFEELMGMTRENAVRRTFQLVMDNINVGIIDY